ncbi:MAG TPA: DUF2007 domain-containing protein [Thermoanaerobaculia bacterium]|nr:DUF2007 domain-containing protein [Thermoanaerobaculia bacterium]
MAEDWEIVKIVSTEEEATIVVGFLQSSGIEAQVESLHASEFPTDLGDLALVRIRVPADQAEDAKALLNQREDVATGDEGDMAGAPLEDEGAAELDPSQDKP